MACEEKGYYGNCQRHQKKPHEHADSRSYGFGHIAIHRQDSDYSGPAVARGIGFIIEIATVVAVNLNHWRSGHSRAAGNTALAVEFFTGQFYRFSIGLNQLMIFVHTDTDAVVQRTAVVVVIYKTEIWPYVALAALVVIESQHTGVDQIELLADARFLVIAVIVECP